MAFRAQRGRLAGASLIRDAIDRGDALAGLLVDEGAATAETSGVLDLARDAGIPIFLESRREMRRMSEGDEVEALLAVAGRPLAGDLETLMSAPGIVLILAGLRYPGNVGFIMRSAEVAGAAGVVLASGWSAGEREEASRISIRADRFLPVLDADAGRAVNAARSAGRQILAIETSGKDTPWSLDLSIPTALLLGSEADGLPPGLLARVDRAIRIPTRGFIPSYNVQAAAGIVLGEWLRQTDAP